ncbi:hypothetical protein ACKLTP_02130 [Paenarthrobacter ureafaciens]|uniref:hypothetical protein n=1 Tax=Paenarthrobacter TaxID=1742992 RepID=UPI001D0C52E2|nr:MULTISPECIES: hypothetical protein [unclassified Paenarthrobacter]MCW3765421.1 hypothetical protein [Paenarthrobacter sp. PAE-2]
MAESPGLPAREGRSGPSGQGIKDLPVRGRATCTGFIESVTHQPPSEQPFFSAIVVDALEHGSLLAGRGGSSRKSYQRLRVVWLGRTRVPGIEAGVQLRLNGMVAPVGGLPTMFNPRYEILSRQENQ